MFFKILTSFGKKMTKTKKVQFSQILLTSYQGSQFLLKLAEIWTRYYLHDSKQSHGAFFENFDFFFWFYANFSPKNGKLL